MTTKNQPPKVATTKIAAPAPSDKAKPNLDQTSKAQGDGTESAATTPKEPVVAAKTGGHLPSTPVGVKTGDLTIKVDRAEARIERAPESVPAVTDNVVDPQAGVVPLLPEDAPVAARKAQVAEPDIVALTKDLYPQYAHDQGFIGVWDDTSSTYKRATVNFVRNLLIQAEIRGLITRN